MSYVSSVRFLRHVLWVDAVSCLACGLLQVTLTATLVERLGLPATLLADTGVFLLLYGAAVAIFAMRIRSPGMVIWLLIAGNGAWAAACIALLFRGGLDLTLLGKSYVVAQALAVLVLADLQYFGFRRTQISGGRAPTAYGQP